MNVRMRQEIRYHFDIDEDALLYSMPKISIQPLVENAINHGLKNKRGEKNIVIKVWQADGKLYVMVAMTVWAWMRRSLTGFYRKMTGI